MNRIQRLVYMVSVVIMLVACRTLATETTPPTIGLTDVNSTAQSAAFRTEVAQAVVAIPTSTVIAPTDALLIPTATITFTPLFTSTPLPIRVLDGLRVAYIVDGNLYVQDSGMPAIQLTHSGQDHTPVFSDDGKKIVFFRGEGKDQLWAINVDGTGERSLVAPEYLLSNFGKEYNEFTELRSLVFVPNTHQVIFNTQLRQNGGTYLQSINDLLVVDAETGEIKRLVVSGQGGNFLVSPNGKYIAIQTPSHIDMINIQGQIIRHNFVTYPEDEAHIWVPMSWVQDSRELIVLPSEIPPGTGFPVLRTIWRYSLDGSAGVEIQLDPPPAGDVYSVSPDGNWIAYSYELLDSQVAVGAYLGNLQDSTSQLLYVPQLNETTGYRDVPISYDGWSPDSVHFIFSDVLNRIYMGNIHGETTSLGGGILLGWTDKNHYLYAGGALGDVSKEGKVRVVDVPTDLVLDNSEPITFVFVGH